MSIFIGLDKYLLPGGYLMNEPITKLIIFLLIGTIFLTSSLTINNIKAQETIPNELFKHGNDYYTQNAGYWFPYGSHGMRCSYENDYIYYRFTIDPIYFKDGSLEIGVKFNSKSWVPWVGGPDLECYNYEYNSWMRIKQSMGSQDSLTWKWYSSSVNSELWADKDEEFINSNGNIYLSVFCCDYDEVIVDDVGLRWENFNLGDTYNLDAYNKQSD